MNKCSKWICIHLGWILAAALLITLVLSIFAYFSKDGKPPTLTERNDGSFLPPDSAIRQMQEKRQDEEYFKDVEEEMHALGVIRGLLIGLQEFSHFADRIKASPALLKAVKYAKENKIPIIASKRFALGDHGFIFVSINIRATDEEIIKFLLGNSEK